MPHESCSNEGSYNVCSVCIASPKQKCLTQRATTRTSRQASSPICLLYRKHPIAARGREAQRGKQGHTAFDVSARVSGNESLSVTSIPYRVSHFLEKTVGLNAPTDRGGFL